MQPNNLTALNFDDIKASIKTYLRTRDEFTDYDFEGSTLSYLIDVLAYNTYYSAFTSNMLINEAFINSASTRANVANIAKLLNYVPRSVTSAKICVKLELQTIQSNLEYPRFVTLKKGAAVAGDGYVFNALNDITFSVDNLGYAVLDKVLFTEGSLLTYSYTVDTFQRQRYIIPNEDVDVSTLKVSVRPNEQSTSVDTYNKVDVVTQLNNTSRIYYLNEVADLRYEVFFGDGVIGRALSDGEIVEFEYIVSSGTAANDIQDIGFVGTIIDSNGIEYSAGQVTVTVYERSQEGSARETVESIKYAAPRYYATQNRAVTTRDYEILTKQVYPNADSVVAFGGDQLTPAVYGKVYVAIKTQSGNKLNNATKLQIAKDLQKYTMASLETKIADPDYLYIANKIFTTYDPNKTSLTASELQAKIDNSLAEFADQTGLNNFGASYNQSKLLRAISLADPALEGTSIQTTLVKYIEPEKNIANTYRLQYGTPILDTSPSKNIGTTGEVVDASGKAVSSNCYKEPVVLSGAFYTTDRPTTQQYFTDDGYGNIYSFYTDGGNQVITNPTFGTVDYEDGTITVGPVAIIGDQNNPPTAVDQLTAGDNGFVSGGAGDGTGTGTTGTTGGTGTTTGTGTTGSGGGTGGTGDGNTYVISDNDFSVPVVVIPSNNFTITPTTPGTIIAFPQPPVTVATVGTIPPSSIPLNSINPGQFESSLPQTPIPTVVSPVVIGSGCFT